MTRLPEQKSLHGLDIHIGNATAIWADKQKLDDTFTPAGWVFPGGYRTADYAKALSLCTEMAEIIGEQKPTFIKAIIQKRITLRAAFRSK